MDDSYHQMGDFYNRIIMERSNTVNGYRTFEKAITDVLLKPIKAGLIFESLPPNFENQYIFLKMVLKIVFFTSLLVSDFQKSVWSVHSIGYGMNSPFEIAQFN